VFTPDPTLQVSILTDIWFAGLRKVHPYYFTFTTFTKGRWVGETILEVFTREFRAQPKQEYVSSGPSLCRNIGV